jgi:hypothetical protein
MVAGDLVRISNWGMDHVRADSSDPLLSRVQPTSQATANSLKFYIYHISNYLPVGSCHTSGLLQSLMSSKFILTR